MSCLLRKYIRRILQESEIHAKIDSQLKKALDMGLRLHLSNWGSANGGSVTIGIALYDGERDRVAALHARYQKAKLGHSNGAALISADGVEASRGLGPLLYDLAFEIAEKLGLTGIGPDAREVSDEATAVWDYYLNNRPDIEAKQRDFMEDPQTPSPDDDSYGQQAMAKKFGGKEKAYSSFDHFDQKSFDDPEGGWDVPTGYTPEFIEFYFDPKNSLSKTYHKKSPDTPILDRLAELSMLSPGAANKLGMTQSRQQIVKYLKDNPKKWPLRSYGGKNQFAPENRLPLDDVIRAWQGEPDV
jgi:hypothetical protein